MLKYQVIPGLALNNPALPLITPRPEDVMANVPGWALMLDPDFVAADKLTVRNRARANSFATAVNPGIATGTWTIGVSAFRWDSVTLGPAARAPVEIGPSDWSFFAPVRELVAHASLDQRILSNIGASASLPALSAGDIAPNLLISSNLGELFVIEYHLDASNGRTKRISAAHNFAAGSALVMATFSTTHGLRLFINGKQVASAPNDKRPLTKRYAANEWGTMYSANGKFGMQGVLNIDLSAPENAGHRRVIEDFIMGKYGIARAV